MVQALQPAIKLPLLNMNLRVIHRLEAGGVLPDTPDIQIIGIYKAYAVPMDFYCDLSTLPSVF